jgi:hypothetical protein
VLCDLAIRAGVPLDQLKLVSGAMAFDGEWATLPDSVVEWAGIKTGPMPIVNHPMRGEAVALWKINDHFKASFGEIASIIRRDAENI